MTTGRKNTFRKQTAWLEFSKEWARIETWARPSWKLLPYFLRGSFRWMGHALEWIIASHTVCSPSFLSSNRVLLLLFYWWQINTPLFATQFKEKMSFFSRNSWPLEMGPIGGPETSVRTTTIRCGISQNSADLSLNVAFPMSLTIYFTYNSVNTTAKTKKSSWYNVVQIWPGLIFFYCNHNYSSL